jgi:HSP20 family protein
MPVRREEEVPFAALQRGVNRLFDEFFSDFDADWPMMWGHNGHQSPRVDVSETETEVRVEAELPGVEEKDVEVSLHDGSLTIRGERKFEKEQKEKNYHRVERSYGTFQRTVPLPSEVDDSKAEAVFKQGVLEIKLPKTHPSAGRKKIEVKSSK